MDVAEKRRRPTSDDSNTDEHQPKKLAGGSPSPVEPASRSAFGPTHPLASPQKRVIEGSTDAPVNRNTKSKGLSRIESLPDELIEKIFLYSLNVNLPRASPILAASVSKERVYRLLILLAFWDNDDFWNRQPDRYDWSDWNSDSSDSWSHSSDPEDFNRREPPRKQTWKGHEKFNVFRILQPLGHDYVPLTSAERRNLQSAIMRCRWCTLGRIVRQSSDLARLIITNHCFDDGFVFEEEHKGRELDELLQYKTGTKDYKGFAFKNFVGIPDGGSMEGESAPEDESASEDEDVMDFPDEMDYGFETCRIIVKRGRFVQLLFYNTPVKKGPPGTRTGPLAELWYPILSLKEIPPFLIRADVDSNEKGLVRGSFTDAHMKFLEVLLHSGQLLPKATCEVHTSSIAYSKDAMQQGIHVAISTINPPALDKLLKIDESFCRKYEYEGVYVYRMPSDPFRTAAQTYLENSPTHDANENDFSKVQAQRDALLCFCLLLTTSAETVPFDDPVITELAQSVGGAFGNWLLDFKLDFPRYLKRVERDLDFELFVSRKPNGRTKLGKRYFKELMAADDLFKIPRDWMRAGDSYKRYDEEDMQFAEKRVNLLSSLLRDL